MTEKPFTRIGRYELRERLGAGGMARVYKAWDTLLQRLVAIKILHEHLADDPSFKERFEREAQLVAGLNHPNIVQVFDYSCVTIGGFDQYYMVMPFVPGSTLRRELDEGPSRQGLTRVRMLQISRDLSSALGYAHERGMAHRDVKPGNVLIDDNGRAILTDFGIARLVQSARLTLDGSSTGTPAYMSPEQASGQAGDARSDLYSLAIIQFEMLLGQLPYQDDASMAVMMQHLNSPVPTFSDRAPKSEPALDSYFANALAKSPDKRFQKAEDQQVALESALGGPATVLFPVSEPAATVTITPPVATAGAAGMPSGPHQEAGAAIPPSQLRRPRVLTGCAVGAMLVLAVLVAGYVITSSQQQATPTLTNQPALGLNGESWFYTRFRNEDAANSLWPQQVELPFSHTIADGTYRLSNELPFSADTVIHGGESVYEDVLLYMDGTLDPSSASASAFGLVFRYRDADNYNVFAVDGEGRFSIWVRENGIWRELRGLDESWTTDPAINLIGEPNVLTLEVRGDQFTGYVNNQKVVQLTDATLGPGLIGIYVGSDDGASTALIDEYRVREVTISMTGP